MLSRFGEMLRNGFEGTDIGGKITSDPPLVRGRAKQRIGRVDGWAPGQECMGFGWTAVVLQTVNPRIRDNLI